MSEINQDKPTFGQYGKSFQEKIMQALLCDRKWAEQLLEVFDVQYFELKHLQYLGEKYFSYAKKYKDFPTLQLLIPMIKDELKSSSDQAFKKEVIDYLLRMRANPDPGDLPLVKDKTLDFCRKQALKLALEKVVDNIATEKYESIVDIIRRAVSVGTVSNTGHDFFEDMDARFVESPRYPLATGIEQLDCKEILQGGLGRGELGVIMAPTGVGKSHFLTMLGANALRMKKNVLHYTFELSETVTGIRYDSNLTSVPSNEVIENKDKIIEFYKNSTDLGRLVIKEFPANSATINMLRQHVEKLSLTKGFVPDLITIDYADIMRSSRQFDALRHELKLVYEELRGWAMEMKIPIWTASQTNRDATDKESVGLESIGEAYGKAQTADVILSISRRQAEKASGIGRIFVAKNRAGKDGLLFPIKIDTARSTFQILGDAPMPTAEEEIDEKATLRRALKDKWKELQNDHALAQDGQ